jgi:hypothetical protein
MQELVQSSRYKITSLSVDSRFADQNYGNPPDTSDFMIRLPEPIKNVMRIRLSSIEIPPVEYTFSVEKGNVAGTLVVPATGTFPFSIPEGNYSATGLAAVLQTSLNTASTGFTCVLDPISGRIVIQNSAGDFTLNFGSTDINVCSRKTHWGLGYFLGFRVPFVESSGPVSTMRSITSVAFKAVGYAAPLISQNTYYLMQIQTPELLETIRHRVEGNAAIPAFAKIILKNNGYGIDMDDNSNDVWKEFTFLAPTNISQLRIKLLDPFGVPIRLTTTDWSATFELTEVVNSHTYETLNKTYAM